MKKAPFFLAVVMIIGCAQPPTLTLPLKRTESALGLMVSKPEIKALWKGEKTYQELSSETQNLYLYYMTYLKVAESIFHVWERGKISEEQAMRFLGKLTVPDMKKEIQSDPTISEENKRALLGEIDKTKREYSQWCDDFNKEDIDRTRWLPVVYEEDLIYVRNGVLNFGITAERSQFKEPLYERLEALPAGRPVREVSFTTTLESFEGKVPGGAGLEIYMQDGRDHSMKVGAGPGGPGIEFYICANPPCHGQYGDYLHPGTGRFRVGARVPMRVVWTGKKLEFYVDGHLRVETSADQTPITGLQFAMNVDPGSIFHVTVDDVCVIYAED